MKHKLLKLTSALLSYAILNAGILGFTLVYRSLSVSSGDTEAVMAYIDTENENTVTINVLGQCFCFDKRTTELKGQSPAALAVCDPMLLAAWTIFKKLEQA